MGYYDQGFLNYYYYMASQFAVSDRWFSPVSSKSIPNRIATFTGGTTQGLVFDPGNDDHLPQLDIPNIFQELDAAKVSWKIYYTVTQGLPSGTNADTAADQLSRHYFGPELLLQYLYSNPTGAACTGSTQPSSVVGDTTNSFCIDPNHIAPLSTYYTDADQRNAAQLRLHRSRLRHRTMSTPVRPIHPRRPGRGQQTSSTRSWPARRGRTPSSSSPTTKAAAPTITCRQSQDTPTTTPTPSRRHGCRQHPRHLHHRRKPGRIQALPAPPAVPRPPTAISVPPNPERHSTDAAAVKGFAAQLGFRVPNMVISPFTRKHYVIHIPMDHTAIIKFVENRFIGRSRAPDRTRCSPARPARVLRLHQRAVGHTPDPASAGHPRLPGLRSLRPNLRRPIATPLLQNSLP